MEPSRPTDASSAADALRVALHATSKGLVERESLVEGIALAAVAREHVLVIGPPGTAKSEAARRFAQAVGGRTFEYLLGRFTEPSEIFGPVDLRKLREGRVETETSGMLPEAEVAFLDEVFRGSTAILNTLLGILNERVFRRGHDVVRVPLRVCVGAANALPDDDALAAFADRFLVRAFVENIPDTRLEALLAGGWRLATEPSPEPIGIGVIDTLASAAAAADLDSVRPAIAQAVRLVRSAGIELSDRRIVKAQRLIAAAAIVAGRAKPTDADLWPLVLAVPTADGQATARDALRELLAASENEALRAAAEDASRGPAARAPRIVEAGDAALEELVAAADGSARAQVRLRCEGIAREIDATFAKDGAPAAITALRARLVAALDRPA